MYLQLNWTLSPSPTVTEQRIVLKQNGSVMIDFALSPWENQFIYSNVEPTALYEVSLWAVAPEGYSDTIVASAYAPPAPVATVLPPSDLVLQFLN